MTMNTTKLLLAIGLALTPMAIASPALADKAPIWTSIGSNVAIRGYDPVAYFTLGRPTEGNATFKATYQGAEFRFASAANRAAFIANPARYAPQFGGYCAWAVSQGYTAGIDPTAWAIVDGKLYLNYNRTIQTRWAADRANLITAGNRNWPTVLSK
jgi:YHS domain-containing protein